MWWRRTSCAAPLKTTYAKVGNSHCRVRVVAVIISVTLSMLHGRVLREREIGMVNLKKSETHVESRDAHAQLEDLLRSNSLACPMTWLSAAEQVPVEMEYLPRTRNLHDCDNNYDSLVQRLLSFPPKRANRATFKPPKDVALGKYMSTALTFFLHTSFVGEHSNAPELHVLRTSVADSCHHHLLPRYTASLFLLPPYVDFLVVVVALFSAVFYRAKVVEDAFLFSCTF